MRTYHLSISSLSPGRANRRYAKLLNMIVGLMIAAVLVNSPILTNAASASGGQRATQDTVAMAACYGVYHIVRPGQTLYSIAAVYGTTAYRIAMCNGLSSYTVYAGQALLIPTYRTR
ncbi:MAG TPA: LysM peptidoglycan-binding domain-containing protein [Chloroflexi bacterium]|nr:LysM peptidoglycan-binding domain-containing protein [Chloroflexota bacterium]